jgi:cytochrome c
MKHASVFLIAGILAVTGAPGAEVDLSKLPAPAAKSGLTFEADIQPLLKASCTGCHGGNRPRGGLRLDTRENVLRGAHGHQIIVSGDSAKSSLVIAIAQLDPKTAMPPKPRQRRNPGGPEGGNPPDHPNETTNAPPAGGAQRGPQGPPPKPLTPEQVGLVRAWIDQGAK